MSASSKTQLSLLIAFLTMVFAISGEGGKHAQMILLFFAGPLFIYSLTDLCLRYLRNDSRFWGWRLWVVVSAVSITVATLIAMPKSCNHACAYPLYFMVLASYVVSGVSFVVVMVLSWKRL